MINFNQIFEDYKNDLIFEFKETFNQLDITINSPSLITLKKNFLEIINSQLGEFDNLIDFNINIDGNTILYNYKDPHEFWSEIQGAIDYCDDITSCKCTVKILIKKNRNLNKLSIYYIDIFFDYLNSLNLNSLLELLYKYKYTYFIIYNNASINCGTNMFRFCSFNCNNNYIFDTNSSNDCMDFILKNCNFANRSSYYFEPANFNIDDSAPDSIKNLFNKLIAIFSLISLFDISSISDNDLTLTLTGNTIYNITIEYSSISLDKYLNFFNIFNWVHKGNNNSDKLLIARNVLLANLYEKTLLELPQNILGTVKSNYKIYSKDNYEKYASAKSTSINTLLDLQNQLSNLSNTLTDNFSKNLIFISTFIFSTVIINSMNNGKFTDIFTKEITLILIGLIFISILLLYYTRADIKSKRRIIDSLQSNIRTIYSDILSEETMDDIIDNNEYYKTLNLELDKRINLYTFFWWIIIIIFLFLTITVGWKHFLWVINYIKDFVSTSIH